VNEGALVGNILEQSMYYATSLARVGLDFRGGLHDRPPFFALGPPNICCCYSGLLGPIFEQAVFSLFSTSLQNTTLRFTQNLKVCIRSVLFFLCTFIDPFALGPEMDCTAQSHCRSHDDGL